MVTDGSCVITVTIVTIVKECGQINVCIYVCVYMCMHMYMCICLYVHVYMFVYVYVCTVWREILEGANFDEMARKTSLPDYTLVD